MALSIDELIAMEDRPVVAVQIPAWKSDVFVRVMTGVELDSYSALREKKPGDAEVRKALFLRGLCDADGNRLSPVVIEKLLTKSGVALEQLVTALVDLNGTSPEAREKKLKKPEENLSETTGSSG